MEEKVKKLGKLLLIQYILMNIFNVVLAGVIDKSYVDISSPSAIVIDYDSGRILYEKNSNEKRSIASLTKIMTSIMLVEHSKMDEEINVPNAATWIGGSEART